ncbi:hypothetical protein [Nocardia cyriacigeorgica]|uniref:hypothetical protein n=1 Tax=Nocardia cyriacigeorgica TaxID=135487 RepID=UPI001E4D0B18|nr:hypothetical protein [Nocardia cyriacigeorgica]
MGVHRRCGAGRRAGRVRRLHRAEIAVADVKRFLDSSGAELTEGVQKLADATQILVDKRPELEQVLHSGPTALVNFYQIYKPAQGTLTGAIALNNAADPLSFLCGSVQARDGYNSDQSAALCAEFLAPVLKSLAINYPPLLANPATGVTAFPDQLVFSPESLAGTQQTQGPAPARGAAPVTVPSGIAGLAIPGLPAPPAPGGGR